MNVKQINDNMEYTTKKNYYKRFYYMLKSFHVSNIYPSYSFIY